MVAVHESPERGFPMIFQTIPHSRIIDKLGAGDLQSHMSRITAAVGPSMGNCFSSEVRVSV
jgi:hypothetical protein